MTSQHKRSIYFIKRSTFFIIGIVELLSVCLHFWFTYSIFSKQANPTAFLLSSTRRTSSWHALHLVAEVIRDCSVFMDTITFLSDFTLFLLFLSLLQSESLSLLESKSLSLSSLSSSKSSAPYRIHISQSNLLDYKMSPCMIQIIVVFGFIPWDLFFLPNKLWVSCCPSFIRPTHTLIWKIGVNIKKELKKWLQNFTFFLWKRLLICFVFNE